MASEEVATPEAVVAAPTLATFNLDNILSHQHDKIETSHAEGWDEETADKPPAEGYCVECEGQSKPSIYSWDKSRPFFAMDRPTCRFDLRIVWRHLLRSLLRGPAS